MVYVKCRLIFSCHEFTRKNIKPRLKRCKRKKREIQRERRQGEREEHREEDRKEKNGEMEENEIV